MDNIALQPVTVYQTAVKHAMREVVLASEGIFGILSCQVEAMTTNWNIIRKITQTTREADVWLMKKFKKFCTRLENVVRGVDTLMTRKQNDNDYSDSERVKVKTIINLLKEMFRSFLLVYFSFVIVKEGKLIIGTIDGDVQKLEIRSISLEEEHACRICHQETTKSFAVCSGKTKGKPVIRARTEKHSVRLFDEDFNFKSKYLLEESEWGCSILSCSFSGDNRVYYCVGTVYDTHTKYERTRGRILVFIEKDGQLQLIAEKRTKGAVYQLNEFHGKLLAAINQNVELYKWVLHDDSSHELQTECVHLGHVLASYLQTCSNFILVGDWLKSISLLSYDQERRRIEVVASGCNGSWITGLHMLAEDLYVGADSSCSLFIARPDGGENPKLQVVGRYNLGEFVNCFRCGPSITYYTGSSMTYSRDSTEIQTLMFSGLSGAIWVLASLPEDQYHSMSRVQSERKEVKLQKGEGGRKEECWKSICMDATSILDGNLMKEFLDLDQADREEISAAVNKDVPAEDLYVQVESLTRLLCSGMLCYLQWFRRLDRKRMVALEWQSREQ